MSNVIDFKGLKQVKFSHKYNVFWGLYLSKNLDYDNQISIMVDTLSLIYFFGDNFIVKESTSHSLDPLFCCKIMYKNKIGFLQARKWYYKNYFIII